MAIKRNTRPPRQQATLRLWKGVMAPWQIVSAATAGSMFHDRPRSFGDPQARKLARARRQQPKRPPSIFKQ